MLLLRTFDEPSSGSRTTEKRPGPRSFTSPISSEATWATRFDSRHASTKRSFIQTSRSTFPACSASVTSVRRRPSVLDVPSLEMIPQLLFPPVEVPPRTRVLVGEVRECLEILHALRSHVFHLRREGLLSERVFPDRPAREKSGGPAPARQLDEPPEDVEVGSRAQDDP